MSDTNSTPTTAKKPTYAAGILSSTKVYRAAPTLIDVKEGHNIRFDFGDIDALAAQIADQYIKDGIGVLEALNVKRNGDRFELVSGERRLRAVRLLMKDKGLTFDQGIPINIVDKNATDVELLIRDFVSNSAKPLLPLEEAQGFKLLQEAGMTQAQIAVATGRGQYHVNASLQLLTADAEVLAAVKDGTIGGSLARDLATKVKDKDAQKEAIAAVRAAGKDKKAKAKAIKTAKTKVREHIEKNNERKGRALKMRALTDAQLAELGTKVDGYLVALLKDAGVQDNDVMLGLCASDNKMAAAFTLGALQALKAAAGLKVNLKL